MHMMCVCVCVCVYVCVCVCVCVCVYKCIDTYIGTRVRGGGQEGEAERQETRGNSACMRQLCLAASVKWRLG